MPNDSYSGDQDTAWLAKELSQEYYSDKERDEFGSERRYEVTREGAAFLVTFGFTQLTFPSAQAVADWQAESNLLYPVYWNV